jgi:ADP-ribose pyrophosphatase YjhB (NUDIX family)
LSSAAIPTQAPRWLEWAREIQALAQTGIHYSENHFQKERSLRLLEIAAEIIAGHTDLETPELVHIFQAQTGYATPRVDVRAAVFLDGRILLVRESLDGGWTMPGGWADVGDLPSASAEREVWEEAGFRVRARRIIGVYDANRIDPLQLFHAYKLVFLCEIESGSARTSPETSEVGFFSPEDLPPNLSPERTQARHLRDAFIAFHSPDCPAVFD